MSLKILGGFAKGHTLSVPKGDTVRPTSVLLRRRTFDFFQRLDGVTFVDLCAGSGAMAFESWSRGSQAIYLNEMSKHVIKIIEENKEQILIKYSQKSDAQFSISQMNAEKFISHFKTIYQKMPDDEKQETIIFLDPPYEKKEIYQNTIKILLEEPWFFGQLWVESDVQKGLKKEDLNLPGLSIDKVFEQGTSFITVTNFPQH